MRKTWFIAALVVGGLSSFCLGYSGGDGTVGNPYQISDANNLLELSADTGNSDKCFILTADIDLSGQVLTQALIPSFTGVFNGNDHIISNLTITAPDKDYVGLFGILASSGQIKKLGIVSANNQGHEFVGGLVGYNVESSISDCYVIGTVSGMKTNIGGLSGCSVFASIISCYAIVSVSGTNMVGGLAGYNYGTMASCYAMGDASGTSSVGGLVGYNGSGTITMCYSTSLVTGTDYPTGGLVGSNVSTIAACFWDIQTSGQASSAGGTGKTTPEMKTYSTFTSAGWDLSGTDGNPADWYMSLNGYPQLRWQSQYVTDVPDTAGLPQADAQSAITAAGLVVGTITNVYDPSVPVGNIISQAPAAGISVETGYVINLVMSQEQTIVPDVAGMSQADAQSAITAAGLVVGTVTMAYNSSVPAGHVISLSLTAGTQVVIGSAVNLEVSLGYYYTGGSGTPSDPYQIASVAGFKQLCAASGDWSKSFILTADIDLGGEVFSKAPITTFSGIFNGNGHSISNFTIAAPDKNIIGLFGRLALNGQIKNLGIVNAAIEGGSQVGGLAGENDHGSITNCYSTGSITGVNTVGGLVGYNYYGTITFCCATGSVSGTTAFVGGLTGDNYSGTLKNCYAAGSVYGGGNYIGGLTGRNSDYSSITNCYSTGLVTGYPSSVGGLAGANSSSIVSCFWDIQTSGRTTSAGGVGKTTAEMKNIATYLNASWLFLYGNIKLGDWVMPDGGYPKLVWQVYAPVTIPNLRGLTEAQARAALETAGLLYRETCSVYDLSVPVGLVSQTFPKSGTPVYAGITPVFILRAKATKYAGGDGVTMPYQIASLDHWFDFMNIPADWNKSFILTTDLDLAEFAFTQAPVAPDTDSIQNIFSYQGTQFTGVFDGKGHKISNLTITGNGRDYEGLFGYIGTGGQVKNLGVADINIQGGSYVGGLAGYNTSGALASCYVTGAVSGKSGSKQVQGDNGSAYSGGLVGWNGGTISSCYAKGIVDGGSYVGGIAGYNNRMGGIINRSYSTGNINGIAYVGGLVGMNYDTITSSYATGDVSGTSYVGGLTGWNNQGKVIRCYSTGKPTGFTYVGGLCGRITTGGNYEDTGNFWDVVTSGITASAMGTFKTTAQMKTLSTFTSAGWDFTNETANGTNDIWRMCVDGTNYPRLTWALDVEGDWMCPDGVGVEDLGQLSSCWIEITQSPADINNDDAVNLGDFIILSQYWMMSSCGSCGGADITGDGNVNELDLTLMIEKWLLQENTGCRMTDLNADGKVDLADYSIFAQHWLEQI